MISLIIPCYNEEARLPPFLENLSENLSLGDECIFVDDGSKDGTKEVIEGFKKSFAGRVKLISHTQNKGKGAAIKTGLAHAKGEYTIFTDADGAIDMKELKRLTAALEGHDIVIGTRIANESKIIMKQPGYRIFVGKTFNLLVNILFNLKHYDTLCGFKGFNKKSRDIFLEKMRSTRWVFDVEMLYLGKKYKLDVYELPIVWTDKRGSKINFFTPAKIFAELIALRARTLVQH